MTIKGRSLVAGSAEGRVLHANMGLSFWGGVDPFSGTVIDQHHPLSGESIAGKVLAIPSGRGSCTGSSVLLELILNGHAPAALVFSENEEILTLGVVVAATMFEHSLPVIRVSREAFAQLGGARHARIDGDSLELFQQQPVDNWQPSTAVPLGNVDAALALSPFDQALIAGEHGKAAQVAMQMLLSMARLQGATEFIDIRQAHIDGCIYTGPASLRFARQLVEWGAMVRVPTTLNSISVDQRRWREQGVSPSLGEPASQLGDAYMAMGARVSFTCAPYLLDSAPAFGDQVVWAESNAVIYANSVLGARTLKYPDYLDICIALTGRAPLTGCHLDAGRRATLELQVDVPEGLDDAFWPLLGYQAGLLAGSEIPVLRGLEKCAPSRDHLKAFSAAFGTTSAAPMFHIAGATPEAEGQSASRTLRIDRQDLRNAWAELNSSTSDEVGLISLGNPHFSLSECATLAALAGGRRKDERVAMVITCGRAIHEQATAAGYVQVLETFGAQFVTDTCWCMLGEPVVPVNVKTLMTNSGKYAHYAPGLVGRKVRFGSLAACVAAACEGYASGALPAWLE